MSDVAVCRYEVIEPYCSAYRKWERPISMEVGGACCYRFHVSLEMMIMTMMMMMRMWAESSVIDD